MPRTDDLVVDVLRLTLWLALLAAIFVPLERWATLVPGRRSRGETARDLGFYFLNSLLPAFLLAFPFAWATAAAHRLLPAGWFAWLDGLPLPVQLIATFVVGEFGFYWGHRWSHEWPILWQFHVVHHKAERIDWLVNTRGHPLDMVFARLCGLVPIYLAGLAGRGAGAGNLPAILFAIVGTIWGFLIHANVRWAPRWLEPLISTPRFHHWHHNKGDPVDRNYASMLPVLDRLFGSLHLPREKAWPKRYGVEERTAPLADRAPEKAGAQGREDGAA